MSDEAEVCVLRVLRGAPSPEEMAAATAVLMELARRTPPAREPAPSRAAPTWHRPALTAHRAPASWCHRPGGTPCP
ncbi:acyl-CoA carboxylase subunit epsilon [Streptomyces sp. NPDC047022]|uniref:acyl-CoA carboxylase subunit epsilon n=1 Tax=Streptomyces sp. NPDC047022 TaxID=3155737 RepID=UPI0033C299EA